MISSENSLLSNDVDITVAVTCYNEASFITSTLDNVVAALTAVGCSYDIVVVDDASRDESAATIRKYIESHGDLPIRFHLNERNRGLGNNYVDAAFLGRGKYYRLVCGDDGEPKEVLAALFRHIGKADIIIPFNDRPVAGKSFLRRLLSVSFTALVNLISGHKIRYYNGLSIHLRYNVLRSHAASYGFGFQADIITRLLDDGATYAQVPSFSIDRKGNKSTALRLRNVFSVGHTLLELVIRRVARILYGSDLKKPVEVIIPEAPLDRITFAQDPSEADGTRERLRTI